MNISDLVRVANETATQKGFWTESRRAVKFSNADGSYREIPDSNRIPEKLMLVVSELSEALEEYRDGQPPAATRYVRGKPEGFPTELADAVIRIADLAGHLEIDLEKAIDDKLRYNKTREIMHGKVC